MRAWKIGAAIGGIIGFSLNGSLTKLIIGAIIGSVLGRISMILISSKVNFKNKGVIIGGLWGLVSFFAGINQTIYFYQTKKSILILPHLILVILSEKWQFLNAEGMVVVFLSAFVLLLDILLGATLGFILAKSILRFKLREDK